MADHHHPGALPKIGETTEIGMAIPLLDRCDVAGKDIAADALLTQRTVATYIVEQQAHCRFTAKGNQPALERDIALLFAHRAPRTAHRAPRTAHRAAPDHVEVTPPDHGRIETRRIRCSTALNRTGFGPENITRLRRFATGILESFRQPEQTIAEMMRKLSLRILSVFDYLWMTKTHARQPGDWRTILPWVESVDMLTVTATVLSSFSMGPLRTMSKCQVQPK